MNIASRSIAETALGIFELQRYPVRQGQTLRAWNSADLLLLEQARALGIAAADSLLVNDEHGALSCALPEASVWTDSWLSARAIQHNRRANGIDSPAGIIPADRCPGDDYQLVLLRIPKHLGLLRYQLTQLRLRLPQGTPVVCAGMDKHLSPGTADLLDDYIGPCERHRGQRKARIFAATLDKSLTAAEPEWQSFQLHADDWSIGARPGVFSGDQLDIGSRGLLPHLEKLPVSSHIVDLGCGNGVLGLEAARLQPTSRISFIDESSLAVESARHNSHRLTPASCERMQWIWSDGFTDFPGPPANLVLCNPPFHQGHVVDDYTGRRLITQAAAALQGGGELWLVANRHLPYHSELRRRFSSVQTIDQTNKFTIFRAVQEPRL